MTPLDFGIFTGIVVVMQGLIEVIKQLIARNKRIVASPELLAMAKQVQDLYDWHSKTDDDGVKVWYVRRSLEKAIDKLGDNLELQTKLLSEMHRVLLQLRKDDES